MNFVYPVELIKDDNNTVRAIFPDVPEAITFGDDEDEALLRACDALIPGTSMISKVNGKTEVSRQPPGILPVALFVALPPRQSF